MHRVKNKTKWIVFCAALFFCQVFSSFVSAENRNVAVDKEIGGMEEGRRIQSPETYSNKGITSGKPGSTASGPITDRHSASQEAETSKAGARSQSSNAASGDNHGFIYTGTQANAPAGQGAQQAGVVTSNINTGAASATMHTGQTSAGETGSANSGTGQTVIGEVGSQSGTGSTNTGGTEADIGGSSTAQESTGSSANPIVGVDVGGAGQGSGTGSTGVSVDTSGHLEERQIVDVDTQGITGSSGAEVGSATDITAVDLVEEADITTAPITGITGGDSAEIGTGGSQGGMESSEPSGNPIVDLDLSVNPESGAVDAGVNIDTSGELEDRQILEADLAAEGAGSTGTEIDSASAITGSQTVGGLDVTTQPTESLIPAPADLSAEIDTTGQTIGSEADIGIAADVTGVSEGDDAASDPADGLSSALPGL